MYKNIIRALTCAILGVFVSQAEAVPTATFVDSAFATGSAPAGQYDLASVVKFIDPSTTNWIAWNNATDVVIANASCQGGFCLGPGGFGTDDYILLTVFDPNGASLGVALDQNTALGNSFGPQNVIFGTAANAPDAIRTSPPFGSPANTTTIFDEAGAHNSIFTIAGNYTFQFSFQNSFTGSASHTDIYLLVDEQQRSTVPEPGSLLLLGTAAVGLLKKRTRRAVATL